MTSRVEIGPLVASTSFHEPGVLAKMAMTVDEISGGRLILGLGAGWNETEYDAFGFPFDHRISRFEEAFTIIRTLLREGAIDFEGSYYTLRDCELLPRGPRPQGPPLLIGSSGPRMLRITAPHVQAWNAWFATYGNTAAGLAEQRELVDAACCEVGRDPGRGRADRGGVRAAARRRRSARLRSLRGAGPSGARPEAAARLARSLRRVAGAVRVSPRGDLGHRTHRSRPPAGGAGARCWRPSTRAPADTMSGTRHHQRAGMTGGQMLKGIDNRLNADVLGSLRAMGHGDYLIVSDTNFPADTIARETTLGYAAAHGEPDRSRGRQRHPLGPAARYLRRRLRRAHGVGDHPNDVPPVQAEVQAEIDAPKGGRGP